MTAPVQNGIRAAQDAPGGFTALPRWTLTPVPGTAEYRIAVPGPLTTTLRRLADAYGTPLAEVVLAAHFKVLDALSGGEGITGGHLAAADGTARPCPLTAEPPSWRELVRATHRAAAAAPAPARPPGPSPMPPAPPAPPPEIVFDPYGGAPADPGTPLRVALIRQGDRHVLELRYRTDLIDADCAARIAGYHLTALRLLAADPDAAPGPQTLLGSAELHHQLEGLAGPARELPDLRVHEIFERQVRAHPDRIAAVHCGRRWTYAELNARANRLAHALLAGGLRREDAVAVVSERNLGWLAAVLAVLKAGGAYLPVEPHFPADRIATMLTRAACRFVLAEPGSTSGLDGALEALPGIGVLGLDAAHDGANAPAGRSPADPDGTTYDPGLPIPPHSLAYIFFTSGSTGEPKGAMCEHAGLLNHLYAKIDDLGIGEADTVAQTAPQCFDISLWQLLSALLTGGRTLIVPQDDVLDVGRFLDTVVSGRATVLQVVPSYLETLLSLLEQTPRARALPDLRCLSVTGEAVQKQLVARWFAAEPGIRLVNAYGLTETSDDTNHEVMDRVPDTPAVPLGRPVNNVRLYVVDPHLNPVPLGAPGEIVLSGVCVGRGYVNDPERTRLAFGPDPHRPGSRLYRSGDYGRWLPDGKVEYLGRRDTQVKVRGFRIEIAEIDNALLRVPGIRDAAVVAVRHPAHGRHLAAFYTAAAPLEASGLRDALGGMLPAYMIPSVFHRVAALPLTANGKTDTKALAALAESAPRVDAPPDADGHGPQPPATPAERRVAAAWAAALGLPETQIGRQDRFFDLGGTSLTALRVAVALDRAITFKDITEHPVLADLARLVDGSPPRRTPGPAPAAAAGHPSTAEPDRRAP
ncbi:amino acid adenylation domain-containing protein [Streptomyces sp. NPDC046866]|uniref:amino acid adenylation domain-containing protein n=1 Tax=Streptomyces sp. NPDC046866 TaxID=3154921 RepID=UPI00345620F0